MCLSVSLKVLIRRWTASRWGNTMMIRSQLWWHLRKNGKTQNSSTPFCLATCVYPCVVWLVLCWPTNTFMSQNPPDSTQNFAFPGALCLFASLKSTSLLVVGSPIVTWCNPCPVCHCESSSVTLMALAASFSRTVLSQSLCEITFSNI